MIALRRLVERTIVVRDAAKVAMFGALVVVLAWIWEDRRSTAAAEERRRTCTEEAANRCYYVECKGKSLFLEEHSRCFAPCIKRSECR